MSVNSDIRDGIIEIVRRAKLGGGGDDVFSAEVTAVDVATRSCTVTSISSEVGMEDISVWLMAQVADGVLYVPKIGSTVIVENNASLQPFVIAWTEIDEILYVVGDATFSMTANLTKFNEGDNDGLVNVKPLVDIISALQKKVNDLVDAWHQFALVYTPGSPSTTGLPAHVTDVSGDLDIISKSDIEDTKVTH